MVALARNLDLAGSCFLTGLTAIFVAGLRQAPARKVRALSLLVCRHHWFSFLKFLYQNLLVAALSLFRLFVTGRTESLPHYNLFGRSTWSSEIDLQGLREL